jgi:hypothetical protein
MPAVPLRRIDLTLGDISATINWGDGTSSAATITKSGGKYFVVGTHTYATNGKFSTLITINDVDGAAISVNPAITVRKPKVGHGHGHGRGHGHGHGGVGAGNPGSRGGSQGGSNSAPAGGTWTKKDQLGHAA